ncbi:MAG: alpha/beta hydrolase [Betaproteobacteria bacterium RIFCSPHIGHO2_12_FULL_69_13]|nr:MAG: alpha/beta hydrolase [Betaproteobacteria bacterium RIFCSPHIGHO2_12_FULL_69_13]
MRESESLFLDIRRLRYHVRRWPQPGAPKMVLLHGWMDVSASFQFVVDSFSRAWDVYAPDWRGYGLSQWGASDCYWMPDYLADLDALLERIEPQAPVNLAGHSLGGNVAAIYAGVRPERVAKLVNLEGFGLAPARSEDAPKRYARWLAELRGGPRLRPYASFAALAERLCQSNPRLKRERAEFLARHWGRQAEDGGVVLRGDPAHKMVNATLYRYEEARACWENVTAPVLWVEAVDSEVLKRIGLDSQAHAERRAAFRILKHVTVAEAGHMLHHDQPQAVARLIEDFLAS